MARFLFSQRTLWMVLTVYLLGACSTTYNTNVAIRDVTELDDDVKMVVLRDGRQVDFGDDLASIVINKVVLRATRTDGTDTTIGIVGTDEIHFKSRRPMSIITLNDYFTGDELATLRDEARELCSGRVVRVTKWPGTPQQRVFDLRPETVTVDSIDLSIARLRRTTIDPPVIPLADVRMIVFERTDALAVLGNVFGVIIIVVGVLVVVAAASSCPLIYADGAVLDAEPLGGAICRGLQRTDLARMDHLDPTAPTVRISIRNQMREVQFIDELSMVAVEHPVGSVAVHDVIGNVFVVEQPRAPVTAVEHRGRSILHEIHAIDQRMWETNATDTAALYDGDLRDHLTFRFVRPGGAQRAGFVVTAGASAWGAHMVKQMLTLHGTDVDAWYARMRGGGKELTAFMKMTEREEQYVLKVYVRKGTEWVHRGHIPSHGPLAFDQRIAWVDLSDIEGDTIEFRVNPPKLYWAIDQVGIVFSPQERVIPVPLRRLSFSSTVTDTVSTSIDHRDGVYLALSTTADRIDMRWERPTTSVGRTHTYFVRITGYYEIDVPKDGPYRSDILNDVLTRPGAATEYGLRQFRNHVSLTAR